MLSAVHLVAPDYQRAEAPSFAAGDGFDAVGSQSVAEAVVAVAKAADGLFVAALAVVAAQHLAYAAVEYSVFVAPVVVRAVAAAA